MPIVSNIEKINESFQIPICFNEKKNRVEQKNNHGFRIN